MPTKNIVLLGIGHTNAHIVKEWANAPIPDCSLTCVSKFPTATYSGMLPGTLGRQFRDEEMRIDIAGLVERSGGRLILGDTECLNLENGTIHFSDHPSVSFDALSIGVGSMPVGWESHAKSPLMVAVKPMQTFLNRLNDRLEVIHGLGIHGTPDGHGGGPVKVAIVGGGVSSIEIAFCLLQQFETKNADHESLIEIYTSSDSIAGGMNPRSVRRLERLLESRNIYIKPGYRVTKVREDHLFTEDGRQHPADCVIWATGASAPPVLGKLGLQTDDRGFVATSDTLQSISDPRVFAVGDSGTVIQSPSPKAGVYAVRQCPILWHNLQAIVSGGTMRSFKPQSSFLKLLNTGDGKALIEYGPLSIHARWCWRLKTWIDKRFVSEFQSCDSLSSANSISSLSVSK